MHQECPGQESPGHRTINPRTTQNTHIADLVLNKGLILTKSG